MENKIVEYIENEQAYLMYNHPTRGAWAEFYRHPNNNDTYIKITAFFYQSGYIPVHKHHDTEEQFVILKGTCTYFINFKRYTAKEGDVVIIPANTWHINPYNNSYTSLIYIITNINGYLLDFYNIYYQQAQKELFVKNKNGVPNPTQMSQISKTLNESTQFQLPVTTLLSQSFRELFKKQEKSYKRLSY